MLDSGPMKNVKDFFEALQKLAGNEDQLQILAKWIGTEPKDLKELIECANVRETVYRVLAPMQRVIKTTLMGGLFWISTSGDLIPVELMGEKIFRTPEQAEEHLRQWNEKAIEKT